MGYRSQVAIVIEFTTPELAQTYLQHGLEIYPELKEMVKYGLRSEDNQKYIVFEFDWVKWYEDYPDVQQTTEFYSKSIDVEGFVGYAFKRIGEDSADYEEEYEGEYSYEYIDTVRRLEVCV